MLRLTPKEDVFMSLGSFRPAIFVSILMAMFAAGFHIASADPQSSQPSSIWSMEQARIKSPSDGNALPAWTQHFGTSEDKPRNHKNGRFAWTPDNYANF